MCIEEQTRDAAIENGVAQEFEPLVVIGAGAAVSQRRIA